MGHPRPAAPRFSPNYSKLARGHDVPFKFHRADAAWPRHASYANLMTSLGPAVSVRVPRSGRGSAWYSTWFGTQRKYTDSATLKFYKDSLKPRVVSTNHTLNVAASRT